MVNRIKVAMPTKEQIEYEEAKKSFRIATAKARLHSAGIDLSKVPQQVIDNVVRIFDNMDYVQQDTQQKISKLQRDAEIAIQKTNQDANQKFGEIQKRYQELIDLLKADNKENIGQPGVQEQIGEQVDVKVEPIKEEIRERTHAEKVAEIADILLHSMRGSVVEKVNEIMCKINEKVDEVVVKSSEIKEDTSAKKE